MNHGQRFWWKMEGKEITYGLLGSKKSKNKRVILSSNNYTGKDNLAKGDIVLILVRSSRTLKIP